MESIQKIKLTDLEPFSKNCRGTIVPFDVSSLAESMKEIGLQQPIVVRKKGMKYEIICGHRRYAAAKSLKWETVSCIVREFSDKDAQVFNLVENLERSDLNMVQEAYGVKYLIAQNMTQAEIASKLKKSPWWVRVRAEMLKLPEEIQVDIAAGFLNQQQVWEVCTTTGREKQYELVRKIKAHSLAGLRFKGTFKKPALNTKRVMKKEEIIRMNGHILDVLGPSLTTRALAWAAGEISSEELFRDIKKDVGDSYEIPSEFPDGK